MALDVRICLSIFILIGASADGCGLASGFATSLLKVAGKAPQTPLWSPGRAEMLEDMEVEREELREKHASEVNSLKEENTTLEGKVAHLKGKLNASNKLKSQAQAQTKVTAARADKAEASKKGHTKRCGLSSRPSTRSRWSPFERTLQRRPTRRSWPRRSARASSRRRLILS